MTIAHLVCDLLKAAYDDLTPFPGEIEQESGFDYIERDAAGFFLRGCASSTSKATRTSPSTVLRLGPWLNRSDMSAAVQFRVHIRRTG